MKRAIIYMRVSSVDQHPETQLSDLRQMAAQRGYEVVQKYTDRISGVKARRPGLQPDDGRCPPWQVRCGPGLGFEPDRPLGAALPRSVGRAQPPQHRVRQWLPRADRHRRPLGRAVIVIGAIAELERNLIIERVRAGMRRAKLDGTHIGRNPLTPGRRSHPAGCPLPGEEPAADRKRPPRLGGYCTAACSAGALQPLRSKLHDR